MKRLHNLLLLVALTGCNKAHQMGILPVGGSMQERISSSNEPAMLTKQMFFTGSGGDLVSFTQEDGIWVATVDKKLPPGFSSKVKLPVHCAAGFSVETLADYSREEQKNLIHIEQTSAGQAIVYIGKVGLMGGGLFNWFGYGGCTMFGCFDRVWRCVCGYKCPDNSCWGHCSKHYQSHKCSGCHTTKRCPRRYTCYNCGSSTYCSNCCGCSERIAAEKERARKRREEEEREESERRRREEEARKRSYYSYSSYSYTPSTSYQDTEAERKRKEEEARKQRLEAARRQASSGVSTTTSNIDVDVSTNTRTSGRSTVTRTQ